MAGHPESVPPRAAACIAHGWAFADRFAVHRCVAFTAFMSGLTLGMALSRIDSTWAERAYDELVEHQAALWGREGAPPQVMRLATWKEAQQIISRAAAARGSRGEEGEER